jgi:DNA-binding transcriptional regulator YbjK
MARAGSRSEATRLTLRQAALDVASEYGVKGVTHRRVAAAAGVALGSASYHYTNIDELLYEAFAEWTQSQTAKFAPYFEAAQTEDNVVAAILQLLSVMYGTEEGRILLYEVYAQSVRDPQYYKLVEEWSRGARASLERLYSPRTAQQLEAVWEGIGVQLVMGAVASIDDAEPLARVVLAQEPLGRRKPRKSLAAKRR